MQMASFLTFHSSLFHCNLMQLVSGLIDLEGVPVAGADTIPATGAGIVI